MAKYYNGTELTTRDDARRIAGSLLADVDAAEYGVTFDELADAIWSGDAWAGIQAEAIKYGGLGGLK